LKGSGCGQISGITLALALRIEESYEKSVGRSLNPGTPEYEAGMLTTWRGIR
jgi:hypothetical protein